METTPENRTGLWLRNGIVALATVVIATLVFYASRGLGGPTLSQLAAESVPLEVAQANGKPTLIEFYTDQCVNCQTMVPTVVALKKEYGDRVNFVVLNANNPRWLPEIDQFKVSGVPHYAFIGANSRPLGSVVGLQPKSALEDNLKALATGQGRLPNLDLSPGQTTQFTPPRRTEQPRDHS